ncbi:hypothetical protein DC083_09215 [Ignatzschineria ureiclastica]|uniref:Copper resistance protein NlpE n=1 Tax=Ignatzschineria ureiclastica TaxID=472582 RepID=A0A2U2ACT9_9GAMM|nr:copper resistance protein NlpE [Ignatzschineria ureiclastica]PWD80476.1 hypothetical protein DC083_09215 [Ignatzschineria ureiclastica]GGZ99183.1 lipoprotein [Ignatzschineria ureiclastica]
MKKKLILALSATLLLAACGDDKAKEITPAEVDANSVEFSSEHTAQNSLDYAGVYKGQYPCADCSGIDVELTLDYNGNYDLKQTYLDVKGKNETFNESGRFTWNKEGQVVTLEGTDGGPDGQLRFFVGENILFPANKEGKRIENEGPFDYNLQKVLPEG